MNVFFRITSYIVRYINRCIYYITILIMLLFISCSKHTVVKEYFDNGFLEEVYQIKGKKYDGVYLSFYKNGMLRADGQYHNNEMNGKWFYYYLNGQILAKQIFNKGNLLEINAWNKDGTQILDNGTGIIILYYSDGDTMSLFNYQDNVKHGVGFTWYDNGRKATEFHYKNGKPTGIWYHWDNQGELIEKEKF
jgi:antitoxin component YwqK of YwqJK toxin-antitoxin module